MMRPVLWSWACVALVMSAGQNTPNLIAIPVNPTNVLTCSGQDCTLVFQPNAPAVCIKRNIVPNSNAGTAQIALSTCDAQGSSIFAVKEDGTAAKGGFPAAATFRLRPCGPAICNTGSAGVYTFSRGSSTLRATSMQLSAIKGEIDCASQGLLVYPTSIPDGCLTGLGGPAGPTGPSGPSGPRGPTGATGQQGTPPVGPCPSRTRRRVRIIITNGTSAVAVAQPLRFYGDEYLLPLSDLEEGEDFYTQKYQSSTVGANGAIETVTAYTIQNVRSGQYLVADVLDNANLNVGHSSPGINLENESEFPPGYATLPDYRFFASYNVSIGDGIILCPLYHRTNCLLPSRKGYVRLASIQGSGQPTENYSFVNPSPTTVRSFLDASAVRNGLVGRWYFRFIDSPKPLPPVWGQ